MKIRLALPLLAAGLALAGCSTSTTSSGHPTAASNVTVEFQNPENFRDIRESLGGTVDQNALDALRMYLQEKAPARLQPGQKLRVTFTDIDLAGDFPGYGGGQYDRVRIIKGIFIPRMQLSFEVTDAAGQVVKQGTRSLTDLDFQSTSFRVGSDQAYFHDKMLLEKWLRDEFK